MAKATLEFNMNDPDDAKALKRAVKSTDMAIVLFEITHNLQRKCPDTKEVEDVFDSIRLLCYQNSINLDELID